MMTKVPLYSKEALDSLNANIKANLMHYRNCDKKWADEFLRNKGFEPNGQLNFATVHLEYVDDNSKYEVDFRNAKKLHQKLVFEDNVQASNGLIWTFLSLDNLDYLTKRWPLPSDDDEAVKTVFKRYGFDWVSSKRKLARGWLASLWRVADLTFDKERSDPYELTEEAFTNSDLLQHLTDRTAFMNRDVTSAVLEYSLARRRNGNPLKKEDYQPLAVFINAVAGSLRIDLLSKAEIRELVEKFFESKEVTGQQTLETF